MESATPTPYIKHSLPIVSRLYGKEIVIKLSQYWKALSPSEVTLLGKLTNCNFLQEPNAQLPIDVQPPLIVTDTKFVQLAKQLFGIVVALVTTTVFTLYEPLPIKPLRVLDVSSFVEPMNGVVNEVKELQL